MWDGKIFKLIQNGREIGVAQANTEREALCKYLLYHEEMTDAMLWRAKAYFTDEYVWKLAEYDDEENCIIAIEKK
jgi:hypothetical protein